MYLKVFLILFFIILGYSWSNANISWNNWWIWDYSEIIVLFLFLFFLLTIHSFYLFIDKFCDNDFNEDDYFFILFYFIFEFIIKYFSYSHNFIIEKKKNYFFIIIFFVFIDVLVEILYFLFITTNHYYNHGIVFFEYAIFLYIFTLNDNFFFNCFFIFNLLIFLFRINLILTFNIFKKFNILFIHIIFFSYIYFYYYRNSFYYFNTYYICNFKKNINFINLDLYLDNVCKVGILQINETNSGFNFYLNFFQNILLSINTNFLFNIFSLNITYMYYFTVTVFWLLGFFLFFLFNILVIKCTI